MTEPILKLIDVSKTYPASGPAQEVSALSGVNIAIDRGEFVVLEGPSGCGKSTLLLTAGGLLTPDEGRLTIGETDVYGLSSAERTAFRSRHIGYVFQQFYLLPYLNVLENVLTPELAREIPDARERAEMLLNEVQMADRLHHVPSTLSVGEQQRVALARALIGQPNLILADEPTGNLDAKNADIILNALEELTKTGVSVLMVTHEAVARNRASRTIAMEKGKIEQGTGASA